MRYVNNEIDWTLKKRIDAFMIGDETFPLSVGADIVERGIYNDNARFDQSIYNKEAIDRLTLSKDLVINNLRDYRVQVNDIQPELWKFLVQNNITLRSIKNWDDYRRATEMSGEKKLQEAI